MTQSSSSEGNRREVFEAELHYDRAFNEHHIGGLVKFNYDSQVATVNIGDDIKMVLPDVIWDWQDVLVITGNSDILPTLTLDITGQKILQMDTDSVSSLLFLWLGMLQKSRGLKNSSLV